MHFLHEYGLFLAKSITLTGAIIAILMTAFTLSSKSREEKNGVLRVKKLNDKFEEMADALLEAAMTKHGYKKHMKDEKKQHKALNKAQDKGKSRDKIFVLNFQGDLKASGVAQLRDEITAVLSVATPRDEVVVCVESGGGVVPNYGLAASQLRRIRDKTIPLTICVDKIAASGGYLMACVGDRILAAPFAIIGSIGVVAQLPNFHRFLKRQNIDFEQITAGGYKRTLTIFGENTEKGRKKVQEEINDMHELFKDFICEHRPHVLIDDIATGEYWLAKHAMTLNLVDELGTSDDYLLSKSAARDIFSVSYHIKESLPKRMIRMSHGLLENLTYRGSQAPFIS